MAKAEKKAKKEKKEKKEKEEKTESSEHNEDVKTLENEEPKRKRGFEKLGELDKKNAAEAPIDNVEEDKVEIEGNNEGEEGGALKKKKRNRTRKKKAPKEEEEELPPAKGALVEGTVYVEGISYDADDSDLITFFEQVGKVSSVRMPRWHDSNKPRGYAHVVFEDFSHVNTAIKQLNNQRLMGRYLKVAIPNAPKAVGGGPTSAAPEGVLH